MWEISYINYTVVTNYNITHQDAEKKLFITIYISMIIDSLNMYIKNYNYELFQSIKITCFELICCL